MHVAYVCTDPGVPVFGSKGCSVHAQEIVRALQGHGAEIELFATRWGGEAPAGLEGVRMHRLPSPPRGEVAVRERAALDLNGELQSRLEAAGPFDLVYERYSLWSYAAMAYARVSAVPGLLEVNAPLIEEQFRHRGLVHIRKAQEVAEHAFGAASALLAVSEGVKVYLRGFPEARGKVWVVPNGVAPERFRIGVRPGSAETFTVGFVGSLKPWHGLPTLLDAFERVYRAVPAARLLIVGDGPERNGLETEAAKRGLKGVVRFTGSVPPHEVPNLLRGMDVAVAPYPALANFYFSPLKVYEYMAAGLPVVASRIGQLEALIQEGINGLTYPAGDTDALVRALMRLWRSPALASRLAVAGRNTVVENHTWDKVAARILAVARGMPEPVGVT